MKFMTKKNAGEIIDILKRTNQTNYFGMEGNEYLKATDMVNMFKECGFGHAETALIMAALVNAGCKFTID